MKTNKSIHTLSAIYRYLLLCIAVGLSTTGFAQAQESTLRSTEDYINQYQAKTATVFEKESAKNLSTLLYAKQDALYVNNQSVQVFGTKPRVVFVSLADLHQLSTVVAHQNNVELMQIRVDAGDNFNQPRLTELLTQFKNLKYLHFVLPNLASSTQLAASLTAIDLPYALMYSVQNMDHD